MSEFYNENSHIYVFYKGERVPWIVPGLKKGDVLQLDPATFTPDMLPKGRIKDGDVTMVPIPKIPRPHLPPKGRLCGADPRKVL